MQVVESEATLNIYKADGEGLNHSECVIRVFEDRERQGKENHNTVSNVAATAVVSL